MSGYFSQLMRQTGVKIAGAALVPESLSAPAAPRAHELEIEESSFVPPPLMTQPGAPFATESEIESDEEPNPGELGESHGSSETTIETTDAAAASSSAVTVAPSPPPASKAAPSHSTIIREVMDWIAEPAVAEADAPNDPAKSVLSPIQVAAAASPEQRALEDDHRLVPSDSPSSAMSFYQTVEHPRPDRSPAAKSGDEAWSVHIGAIHLEIEAPREKPSPRAVAPQPASPAASESRGSRLRRYYLRPS